MRALHFYPDSVARIESRTRADEVPARIAVRRVAGALVAEAKGVDLWMANPQIVRRGLGNVTTI